MTGATAATPTPAASDAHHSLLSKAHKVAQTDLAAFGGTEGRTDGSRDGRGGGGGGGVRTRHGLLLPDDTFGAYDVQELEVKSALTRCRLPGEPWSLNPYTGCSHDCVYCYVPTVAHLERARWGTYVAVKRNLPTVLAHELKRKEKRTVFLSSATDPYQPAEGTYRITRRCLELLLRKDWPVHVLTRNPLVRRDLPLIAEAKARGADVSVGMSIPTLDDHARRVIEPGAPPIQGRLATIRTMAEHGLEPFVNLAPAYPFTADIGPREIAAALKDAGAAVVYAAPWRYLEGVLPMLKARTEGTLYDAFAEAVQDKGYYDRMFRALGAAFRREGVEFRLMW